MILAAIFSARAQTTDLPVIRIETQNGVPITSKEDYTPITFSLTDPLHPENNFVSNNPRDEMRGRGNVTWNYTKKPYRIRFRENTSLFGRAAYRNWILLAEWRDPTFLTTPTGFELGRNVFDYQPYTNTYQHVQLYLNGRYEGLYGLTEHRQASPDGIGAPGRVGIDPLEGWLVQMSIYPEPPQFRTRNYDIPLLIQTNNAPTGDPDDGNNPYYNFIKNDWNDLCDLMVSSRFPENGYRDLIDLDCLVDYMLVNELIANTDGPDLLNSVFVYKDKGGKIGMGPVWDLDVTFGWDWGIHNHIYFVQGTSNQYIPKHAFFRRFYEDPVFLVKYKEHWNQKYAKIVAIADFIAALGEKIRPSVLLDTERWDMPDGGGYAYNYYNQNHAQLTGQMVDWWNRRVTWLNTELNKVEMLPASLDFGTATYDRLPEISPQSFTLITYGDISELTTTLRNANAAYAISEVTRTSAGNGGYLFTFNVKPAPTLSSGVLNDVLVIRGVNQGKTFNVELSLRFTLGKERGADVGTPTVASHTLTSITVNALAAPGNGQTIEYAVRTINTVPNFGWQTALTFNDLTPYANYYVFARSAENNQYYAGAASVSQRITTNEVSNDAEIQKYKPLRVFTSNGLMHISGLIPGETIYIYNALGGLVYQGTATGNEMDISLNVKGIYVVRAGDRAVKAINN